jgi:hypothetical protein
VRTYTRIGLGVAWSVVVFDGKIGGIQESATKKNEKNEP